MIATYEANQARFHAQYRDTQLSGTAVVTGIKTDPLGTGIAFFVYLDINGSRVNCDTKNRDVAAALDKGQIITFSGRVYDVVLGALDVRNCEFRPVAPIAKPSDTKPPAEGSLRLLSRSKEPVSIPISQASSRSPKNVALTYAQYNAKMKGCPFYTYEPAFKAIAGKLSGVEGDVIVTVYAEEACNGGNTSWLNLVVLAVRNGKVTTIAETTGPGFDDLRIVKGQISVVESSYDDGDARCCPSIRTRRRFAIEGDRGN